ncbi:hypothetical protein H0H81_007745 [Sphagnurus paluster]|uniref:Proteophosphoglycan ppg4 n=1 Tax=Sphagnurus paluster TaxID=117069 RepID=A0A9P7FQK8_9AGAR|nr:hypothetical protein H0H81_007745 [Sphagnurus paluster]
MSSLLAAASMAAALHPSRNDTGPNVHATVYPARAIMADLDFQDTRYPTLKNNQRASTLIYGAIERSGWESSSNGNGNDGPVRKGTNEPAGNAVTAARDSEQRRHPDTLQVRQPRSRASATSAEMQSLRSQSQQSQAQSIEPQRNTLSYALPPGASRRVIERYSLDDTTPTQSPPLLTPADRSSVIPQGSQRSTSPIAGIGAGARNSNNDYPIMPLSASPSYTPPVAPQHRAYAQQPTYITPQKTPTPIQTVYSPRPPPPQEEICVECAMRDEDMADVDVTSPGVWERESEAVFEELRQREEDDDAKGIVTIDDPKRPRIKGGLLTEQNLKLWLSVNPREPASRQQTLRTYIKSQKTLLEAEALAHARAMQEAKQLDSRMRDTYSQLRRSAYDLGNSNNTADDMGGVRIKPPQSPSTPANNTHGRSHSREVTLLENGMIVEHVDVRREEREARERKRKEERRARKSSRGSTMDVTSIISAHSLGPAQTDGGFGLRPQSAYSPSTTRPTSALTAPLDRPDLPQAYSQASFSDFHSLGSASPRRTRFFGFKNLSVGWRSQDSLAPSGIQSGSMVDMQCVALLLPSLQLLIRYASIALQREGQQPYQYGSAPTETNPLRRSQFWPDQPEATEPTVMGDAAADDNPKKKKKGLAKIWGIVTGSKRQASAARRDTSQSFDRTDDDLPLAPPPPLSYLVNRGPSELRIMNGRHGSTPSLPSLASPKLPSSSPPGMSPSTGPSSIFPSPASSRNSGPDVDIAEARQTSGTHEEQDHFRDDTIGKNELAPPRNVHPVTSEPDMRMRMSRNISPTPPIPMFSGTPSGPPARLARDKSLPPLPADASPRTPTNGNHHIPDARPRTVYTYDPRQPPPGSGPAHDFLPPNAPFRNPDIRRQSFGGLSSRPNLAVQTMPVGGSRTQAQGNSAFAARYDEFGNSRRSLGPLDQFNTVPQMQMQTQPQTPATATKRKSRFAFASLLGKKRSPSRELENVDPSPAQPQPQPQQQYHHHFPPMRRSGSDGQDDGLTNGYATSTSRHSALSASAPQTRMSITSRKALEERVAQDPEFVAYRYPSNDQRLDLLR